MFKIWWLQQQTLHSLVLTSLYAVGLRDVDWRLQSFHSLLSPALTQSADVMLWRQRSISKKSI